jgi:hypothetical protein
MLSTPYIDLSNENPHNPVRMSADEADGCWDGWDRGRGTGQGRGHSPDRKFSHAESTRAATQQRAWVPQPIA